MTVTQGPAVVLLSGGMDSSCLVHYVARRLSRSPVHALSFHYRQRHSKELACARHQAEQAGAHHVVMDLSFLAGLLQGATALVEGGGSVPNLRDLAERERDQPPTYVPNRNMILLAVAAAYAEARGVADVFYGAQALDEYGYWDCTAEFVDRLNGVLSLNRRTQVVIHAPFLRMKKAESLKIGIELGVDYARTWSCYRGEERPCGACPTCVERLNAFREVGIPDPLQYTT